MEVTSDIRKRLSDNMDRDQLAMWFGILDNIRESGQVNMGASAGILQNSGLERRDASAVAQAWMATFSHVATMEQRVEEAFCEVYHKMKYEGVA